MTTEEKNTQRETNSEMKPATNSGTAPSGGTIHDGHTHKLAEPFTWEGRTYEEFTFQFAALTGSDMLAIEQEMTMLGEGIAITPEYSTAFTYRLAARAAGVNPAVIQHLPFAEFNAVRRLTKNFMLRG